MALHGYPRAGEPIAPVALRELLRVPSDVLMGAVFLSELDGSAWARFEADTCRLLAEEVLEEVHRWYGRIPSHIESRKLGWPAGVRLDQLGLGNGTFNALRRAGLTEDPELLLKVTIGDLVAIRNFGTRALVDLLTAVEAAVERPQPPARVEEVPSAAVGHPAHAAAAEELAALPAATEIMVGDPRLNRVMRVTTREAEAPTSIEAQTVHDLARSIAARILSPLRSQRVADSLTVLNARIVEMASMKLEDELADLVACAGSERNAQIVARRLGWDGGLGETLEETGRAFSLTRERVRQLERKFVGMLMQVPRVYAPRLDDALQIATRLAPTTADAVATAIAEAGIAGPGSNLRSLVSAARVLGRDVSFEVAASGQGGVVVPASSRELVAEVRRVAKRSIEHWGVSTVEDIVAKVTEHAGPVSSDLVTTVLGASEDVVWLDDDNRWFWIPSVPRSRLLNQIEKIMAVAPRIHISELRAGVGRHYRMKGFSPPRQVLTRLLEHLEAYEVEGEFVYARPPLDWVEVLADTEESMVRVLHEHGPLLVGTEFERLCVERGMNSSTFYVYLGYSPIISRYARGVYGLRGADIPTGAAEALVPPAIRRKTLSDYGWTADGSVWLAYSITEGLLRAGVVSMPSAMRPHVEGEYELEADDGSPMGRLVARDSSIWGLGPFFRRRGGEPGDTLLIVLNRAGGIATIAVGSADLLDRLEGSVEAPQDDDAVS